jgi:hypothetical protein
MSRAYSNPDNMSARACSLAGNSKVWKSPDFRLDNHGTISVLFPVTAAAHEWVEENLPADRMHWGAGGTVIEHRYVRDIVNGIVNDGLEIA